MRVMYIPGFLGSALSFDPAGSEVYYPSLVATASNNPLVSALDVDGISPAPAVGKALFPSVALNEELLLSVLTDQLPEQSLITSFAWDWRKSLLDAAAKLVSRIEFADIPGNPLNIVAHSAGGLVAIMAARMLRSKGEQHMLRRIVCLGSPYEGTYYPLTVLAGGSLAPISSAGNTAVEQIVTTLSFVAGVAFRNLVFSWPGFVDLFPFLGVASAAGDPLRSKLFEVGAFPFATMAMQQARLTDALSVQNSVAAAAQVTFGTGLVVNGVGRGTPTVSRQVQSGPFPPPPGFVDTTDGDGIVTQASSQPLSDLSFLSSWTHTQLVANFALSGALAKALTQEAIGPNDDVVVPVESLPMTLVPLTNALLIALLNKTHRFRELFTVVGFTGQDPTQPYVFTLDRSMRRAHRFARVIKADVGGVYVFNGTAWFYVPSPKIPTFYT